MGRQAVGKAWWLPMDGKHLTKPKQYNSTTLIVSAFCDPKAPNIKIKLMVSVLGSSFFSWCYSQAVNPQMLKTPTT